MVLRENWTAYLRGRVRRGGIQLNQHLKILIRSANEKTVTTPSPEEHPDLDETNHPVQQEEEKCPDPEKRARRMEDKLYNQVLMRVTVTAPPLTRSHRG